MQPPVSSQQQPLPPVMQSRPVASTAPEPEPIFIPGDWFYGKNITVILSKKHTAVIMDSGIIINGVFSTEDIEPEIFKKDDVIAAFFNFCPIDSPELDVEKPLFFPNELLNVGAGIEMINNSHFVLKECGMYEISWNIAVDQPCKVAAFISAGSILGMSPLQKEIRFALSGRTVRKKQLIGQATVITREVNTIIYLKNVTIPPGLQINFNDKRIVSTIVIQRLV